MTKNKNKTFWGGITSLSNDDLEKTVEKVEIESSLEHREAQSKVSFTEERSKKSVNKVVKEKKKIVKPELEEVTEPWLNDEDITGQLSVDLYDDGVALIIESTIAGVKPEDIDISVEPDLITIRGTRKKEKEISKKNYFYQECFWGTFARTLVLPTPVKPDEVKANIKNGVLIITLPKAKERVANIEVK